MTNTSVSPAAASAREAARATDGKFGTQARAEAEIDLTAPAPAAAPAPFRSDALWNQLTEMRTDMWRRQEELESYTELLRTKSIATDVLAAYPQATRVSIYLAQYDDGDAWRAQSVLDADGNDLDVDLDELEAAGSNLYEAMIDCDLDRRRESSGFRETAYGDPAWGQHRFYLDLHAAATADDTPPFQLLDPSSRPLTAPEQVQLVQLASYYTDAERERLGELVVSDFESPERYAYSRGELIEAEALVAAKRPGETNAGYAAGWALQDESNFNLHSVEIAVSEGKATLVAATDADTHGRAVEEVEPEDLEFIQESSALAQVIDRFEIDKLSDEQLAVSGITRTATGYRITNRAH